MISFFANGHGSGEIRGRQIAEHLGARLNPTEGFENDVCIYVKRKPPEDYPKRSYLDILDASARLGWLTKHPDIGVIASSLSALAYLQKTLGVERDVVYIPQHHCNFGRFQVSPWTGKPSLGVVGGKASMPDDLAERFGVKRYGGKTRGDVVAAYMQIDIQVIWRSIAGLRHAPLKNALKIVNAASFGIPTIALPEPGYEDMAGYYWPAETEVELGMRLEELKDSRAEWLVDKAADCHAKAEEYHIEHIAKRYLDL